MKRLFPLLFAATGWFAIIAQYLLMINNSDQDKFFTTIKFFSFFTILTNTALAAYFTAQLFNVKWSYKPGLLTALTVYITIVGLVYQLLLRNLWQPEGLQRLVDELLHSVIPLCSVFYWIKFEHKPAVHYQQFYYWLIYPLVYLVWILVRGSYSGFYPYPFVNVSNLGLQSVLSNSCFLLLFFAGVSTLYIFIGKKLNNKAG